VNLRSGQHGRQHGRTRRRTRGALTRLVGHLGIVTLIAVAAVPNITPPAAAQVGDPAEGPARISVSAIDLAVGPGAEGLGPSDGVGWTLLVENAGDATWQRLEVIAEVHGALGSRSALRSALAGGSVPPVLLRRSVPGGDAPLPPGGVVRLDGFVRFTGSTLSSTTTGVHPFRLRVVADGVMVGRIDTAVVRLGTVPAVPLSTSLVWPVTAPPLRDPSGAVAPGLDPLTAPGGRLDTLTVAVSRDGVRGVGLAVDLHLVEDLARRAVDVPPADAEDPSAGPLPDADVVEDPDAAALRAAVMLERLRSTARDLADAPVVTPYGRPDLARLLASGPALQPLAARSALEGARRVTGLLGRTPSSVVLLDAPVEPDALDLLPSGTLLLPYSAIEAPDIALDVPLGEPVRSLRTPTGRVLTVVFGDPYLTLALGVSSRSAPGDPVLAAHEVLVRTAMIHLEAPGRAGRSVLLLPPDDFDPDPRFAATLLSGLAAAPWLDPVGPSALVEAAQGEREPVVLAEGDIAPLPSRLVDALRRTERDLDLLVGATDGVPDGFELAVGARDLRTASDELLRAVSRAFAGEVDTALALLDGVRAGVDSAFGVVELTANDVTLTDRDGIVPLTVVHTGGVTLRVRVAVTGPAALTWTEGRVKEVLLGPDATTSLEIPVRSGPTGRFPVTVRVTDPTGERLLAEETLSVRATAAAVPALALITVLVIVLTVIGLLRQRRRGPSVDPDRAGGAASSAAPEPRSAG